jgi:MFS family permease
VTAHDVMSTCRSRVGDVASVLLLRNVRRLWLAQVLSGLGDWSARLALTVLVFNRSGSALQAALVYAVSLIPYLFAPVLASALRRTPPRAVLIACDLVRCCLFVTMALSPPTWLLLTLALVAAVPSPLFEAVRTSVLPALVPEERTADVLVLQQLTVQVIATAGLLLGGGLVLLVQPTGALLANAVTFLVSARLIMLLPQIQAAATDRGVSAFGHVVGALRTVRRRPMVTRAVLLGLTISPGTMACEAIVAPYAAHMGIPKLVGLLAAAPAASIALGGLFIARTGDDNQMLMRATRIAVISGVLTGALLVMPGSAAGAIAGYLVLGVPNAVTPILITLTVRNLPREALATVIASVQAVLMTLNVLGALMGGVLGDAVGVQMACGISMATAIAYPLWLVVHSAARRSLPAAQPREVSAA